MGSLTLQEILGIKRKKPAYCPSSSFECESESHNYDLMWKIIYQGQMPELYSEEISPNSFWASYIKSYMERDVRALTSVRNERKFYDFLVACVARSGQIFSASSIANAIDCDHKTVQSWVSILQASGMVRLVYPFWDNVNKRLTKAPKLYFMDTGVVCYLTRWTTADQIRVGAVSGQLFETFVVSEIFKSFINSGRDVKDIWFYRDSKKNEIDLVIQEGHILHPVEIKTASVARSSDVKSFKYLKNFNDFELGFGHVICQAEKPHLLTDQVGVISPFEI